VLLGATGTGKTFTMANVIARVGKPTLIVSHNKTLAAQLFEELKEFLPNNSVNYFVSYYDYYQPEAYIPQRGHLHRERTRRGTTISTSCAWPRRAISFSRRDTVVVASVVVHLRAGLAGGVRREAADHHQGRGGSTGASFSWR